MRKQYHFWPGEQGLDAWDVDRLIRLSADLPVITVPPRDPRPGHAVLVVPRRPAADRARARRAHAERVMDGMHRIVQAVLEGRTTIEAVRSPADPAPDYRNAHPDALPYGEDSAP